MQFWSGSTVSAALCAALFSVQPDSGKAQSFDCSKAGNPTEHEICDLPDLRDLDTGMATAYRIARESQSSAAHEQLSANQRAWLSQRNICDDDYNCI